MEASCIINNLLRVNGTRQLRLSASITSSINVGVLVSRNSLAIANILLHTYILDYTAAIFSFKLIVMMITWLKYAVMQVT